MGTRGALRLDRPPVQGGPGRPARPIRNGIGAGRESPKPTLWPLSFRSLGGAAAPDKIGEVFQRLFLIAAAVAIFATAGVTLAQQRRSGAFDQSINHPAIKYLTADTDTIVDRMNAKLRDGSAKLVYDPKTGYLKSVLELLNVPVE